MYIVEVIPVAKGINKDTLSYFSLKPVKEGSFIEVKVRNKKVPALVLENKLAIDLKAEIKSLPFETKSLEEQKEKLLIQPSFLEVLKKLSRWYASPLSEVASLFLPSFVLKNEIEIEKLESQSGNFISLALQQQYKERINAYKTLIRETFAKKESVMILAPHSGYAQILAEQVSKGIQNHVFILHSELSEKKQAETWSSALKHNSPIVAIVTRGYISLARDDFGAFIIEQASNDNSYIPPARPFVDARSAMRFLAKQNQATLLEADLVLPLSVQNSINKQETEKMEHSLNTFRTGAKITICDLSAQAKTARKQKEEYQIFSKEVKNLLSKKSKTSKIAILVARGGLFPQTVCFDCGNLMRCPHCSAPMVLHGKSSTRMFLCHRCGLQKDAKTLCSYCGSWHLQSFGVGIQKAQEELKKLNLNFVSLDESDTPAQTKRKINKFNQEKSGIIIGTPKLLNTSISEVDFGIILSLDAFLAIPHFNAEVRTFRLAMKLKELSKKVTYIQTRTPNHHIIKFLKTGRVNAFLDEELKIRKKLGYPPFKTFITIKAQGGKNTTIKEMQKLLPFIEKYKPRIFQDLIPISKNKFELSAMIKISNWPDDELAEILKHLPPLFKVFIE